PSSEVEFRGVAARRLGEEGRGVPTIIEMVTHTPLDCGLGGAAGEEGRGAPTISEMVPHARLDCVIGSAAGMRRGVAEAINHARGRSAFGGPLAEKPLCPKCPG